MNALEILQALVEPGGLPSCPVVVLTGGSGTEQGGQVLRAGAQDYITKDGLTPIALTRVVENAVERLVMAREISEQRSALLLAQTTLSDAYRQKDEFIATLAHELRNPLAPVRTGLQVLRLAPDTKVTANTIDTMERHLCHVTRLIDDLLDVSRITTGKVNLRLQSTLISAVIEAAAEAVRPAMAASGHVLTILLPEEELWVDGDPSRLTQVLGNLLNNATKYCENGSPIVLSARIEGNQVLVQVVDQGLGIPEAMLDKVFDMFIQVNNTLNRAQGGLGVGLALVKQLVELHGGTVAAESAGEGQGSTFSIRLPRASAPMDAEQEKTSPLSATSIGRRILVVDDNVNGAMMLAMMLDLTGHATRTAFNGHEALAIAEAFDPEIVFLDIGLPDMNGYKVAKLLKAMPTLANTMLVALTGWGSKDDRRRSEEAGFHLHLIKPVEIEAVVMAVLHFGEHNGTATRDGLSTHVTTG